MVVCSLVVGFGDAQVCPQCIRDACYLLSCGFYSLYFATPKRRRVSLMHPCRMSLVFFPDSLHLAAPKSRRVFGVVLLPWFLVLALRVCGALSCTHSRASNSLDESCAIVCSLWCVRFVSGRWRRCSRPPLLPAGVPCGVRTVVPSQTKYLCFRECLCSFRVVPPGFAKTEQVHALCFGCGTPFLMCFHVVTLFWPLQEWLSPHPQRWMCALIRWGLGG